MLRLVSYGLDHHWRQPQPAGGEVRDFTVFGLGDTRMWVGANQQSPSDYRKRVSTSLSEDEYSFINFVGYCLYPPLYIAGPIITFNDFTWQVWRFFHPRLNKMSRTDRRSVIRHPSLAKIRYHTPSASCSAFLQWKACCIQCISWRSKTRQLGRGIVRRI